MFLRTILVAAILFAQSAASAGCTAESTSTRPHLVELYSSEGCSSCPPAEQWLRSLHTGSDVVPLEFHVDYWDNLGWRDRFADARYTARQQAIASRSDSGAVFTPQVVLDGSNWSSWYRDGHLSPPPLTNLTLRLNAEPGKTLRARVESNATSSNEFATYRTYLALVEDGLSTQVQAGENRGVLLKHDHVVRAFAGPLPLAQASADIVVPTDVDSAHATLIAFAQDLRDGKIAQVVALPLSQCR